MYYERFMVYSQSNFYHLGGDLASLTVDLEVLGALRVILDVVVHLIVGEGSVLVDGVRPGH